LVLCYVVYVYLQEKTAAATHDDDNDDDDDDIEIADTPPQRVTRSKMRRAPLPNNPVAMTTTSAVPVRLTRSKMARKTGDVQTTSVPESTATNDSTPTPSTDGFTEPVTPPTVVVKGSVLGLCCLSNLLVEYSASNVVSTQVLACSI